MPISSRNDERGCIPNEALRSTTRWCSGELREQTRRLVTSLVAHEVIERRSTATGCNGVEIKHRTVPGGKHVTAPQARARRPRRARRYRARTPGRIYRQRTAARSLCPSATCATAVAQFRERRRADVHELRPLDRQPRPSPGAPLRAAVPSRRRACCTSGQVLNRSGSTSRAGPQRVVIAAILVEEIALRRAVRGCWRHSCHASTLTGRRLPVPRRKLRHCCGPGRPPEFSTPCAPLPYARNDRGE